MEKGRGEKEWRERKCKEAKVGGFIDGSHECGREGSGDCGIGVMMDRGVYAI